MKVLKIELKDKFADRQIIASATLKGWQSTIANPKRGRSGEPVVIDNPITAEMFLKSVILLEFNKNLITFEARESAGEAERKKRAELEKELEG